MSSNKLRRIAKEIEETAADVYSKVVLKPANNADDLTHLEGQIEGPPDTPYEGGKYIIDIRIPADYPFRPPQMKFSTKVWHPNVSSQTGAICLDTLSHNWSPVLTIKSALISVQGLLASPEPKDPQDAEVAGQYIKNRGDFEHVAHDWAVKYAGAPIKVKGESSGNLTESDIKKMRQDEQKSREDAELAAYNGYNKDLIDRFCQMGFDVGDVVEAFEFVGIDRNGGEDYELEEEYMGDVTARLFHEP